MKYVNWIIKLVSLLIIIGGIMYYQSVAKGREVMASENEAAIAEAEAYNKEILRQIEEAERLAAGEAETEAEEGPYANGSFEGHGTGYGGTIVVSVDIEGGYISSINVLDHSTEDPAYYMLAETIVKQMEEAQSNDVDAVSGATLSSTGLIQAVGEALSLAGK